MSTSTLGGFEREERKVLYDEYLFQRRVLFGFTISIVFIAFLWTLAICSDNWIIVAGDTAIFQPGNGRYFLSSYMGLWRLCRYAITPVLQENSTLPRTLATFNTTNPKLIVDLKKDIAHEAYIEKFLNNINVPIDNLTKIDDKFKETLFAQWIRNSVEFPNWKSKYNNLRLHETGHIKSITSRMKRNETILIIPHSHNHTVITQTTGISPSTVQLNGHTLHIYLPINLQAALFSNWEEHPKVIWVLNKFAQDMDILVTITNVNGTRIVLQPPEPPNKGKKNKDYFYKSYENCQYHNFFLTSDEINGDPSIDMLLLDLLKTQASFACFALLIMSMAFVFSMYTFLNPRYMFKRLAAGVHFISASVCFVVIRMASYAVEYVQNYLNNLFPPGAEYSFGYAVYFCWVVFIVNAFASFIFLWYSKKKKGNKAATEELAMADEPIQMGR